MVSSFWLDLFSVLASIAGVLMSLSHFFQAGRILKRKSAEDVSLVFYSLIWSGSFIWLVYGFLINDFPLILSFSISVFATSFVMFLILKFRFFKK